MLYFSEKAAEIAAACPHRLLVAGGCASRPPTCSPHHLLQLLLERICHAKRVDCRKRDSPRRSYSIYVLPLLLSTARISRHR